MPPAPCSARLPRRRSAGNPGHTADGRAHHVMKMTLEGKILDTIGKMGPEPGHFFLPHGITVDKDGAIYVTEINGKRVQRFILEK